MPHTYPSRSSLPGLFPLTELQFLAFPYLLVPLGKPCWGAWDRGLDPWESLEYNLFF